MTLDLDTMTIADKLQAMEANWEPAAHTERGRVGNPPLKLPAPRFYSTRRNEIEMPNGTGYSLPWRLTA